MERLRALIGAEQWLVFGGSWGSTLALAYAETHPDRVSELVLRGIFTLRRAELDWFYQFGTSEIFPDHWQDFLAPIPLDERHDLRAAYRRRLISDDPAVRIEAAKAWALWEGRTITLLPDKTTQSGFADPHFAVAFARIENHYIVHGGWMEEGQLIAQAGRLSGIRGTIVQGRYDVVCPVRTAYDLHKAWPQAELRLIDGAGHAYSEPETLHQLILATDRYRAGNGGAHGRSGDVSGTHAAPEH
jgi:proline iminopeptidase